MGNRGIYRIGIVLLLLAVQTGASANPSPIGYWKFDDGAGLIAIDSSGGGGNGALQSAGGMKWVTGKLGGALTFDGIGWVDIPAQVWGSVHSQLTVAFWAFGNPGLSNCWGFFAGNASESRVVSCHIPWGGSVYFDTTPATGWERINKVATASEYSGQWHHWAFVKNADTGDKKVYLDGALWLSGTGFKGTIDGITVFRIGAGNNHSSPYTGMMDDFRLYNVALADDQIKAVLRGEVGQAAYPAPKDAQSDVVRDVVLSWTAGPFAQTHDVYLGTVLADVNDASRTNPKSVLVSQGQADTTFTAGRLTFGQTYFWRVDEVNAAPDSTIYKGGVWSFTVEPYSYPLAGPAVTATASSSSTPDMGPQKTVDGSGLNAGDQHGTDSTSMWLSSPNPGPAWIQYAFDKTYQLDRMLVWNSNQVFESALGFGAKAVTIEYSTDANTWNKLGDFEFARAPGTPAYVANTTVDFKGTAAKFVKLTIQSNWGGMVPQYGLSEVRFFQMPVAAREPNPAAGAINVAPQVTLKWRAGREAGSHQVFLGTDPNQLALTATVATPAYDADLNLAQTYYWKVVEVNQAQDPTAWSSDVWSFATAKYLAIDDFESYTDDQDKNQAIFQTWSDGFGTKTNGAIVGNNKIPFAETSYFAGGKQSLPLTYDNTAGATYSEAERTFNPPQDWTKHGCQSLVLYFFGDPNNTGQPYVKINGVKVPYGGSAADLLIRAWQPWAIDLASVNTNLQKVAKLAIGVNGATAKGKLLIDDIRLYPRAAQTITPADPGTQGLVAWYKLDGDAQDTMGGHDGTPSGSPAYGAGKIGQALNIIADAQYITVPYADDLALNSFTVAAWVKYSDKSTWRGILGTRFNGDMTFDLKANASTVHGDLGTGTAWQNNNVDIPTARGGNFTVGAWHHIAYAIDSAGGLAKLYLDGVWAATVTFTGTSLFMKAGQELRLGTSYGTEYMRGALDDVRIYKRALSDAEAAALAGRTDPFCQPF